MAARLASLEMTDLNMSMLQIDREIEQVSERLRRLVRDREMAGGEDAVLPRETPQTSTPVAPTPAVTVTSFALPPPQQSVRKLQKPIVMPDMYSGQANFKDWLAQFNICKNLNSWTDEQACQIIVVKLKGSALQVYSDMDEQDRGSYEMLTQALRSRFDPDRDVGVYWTQLKNRVRRKGETLSELAGNIRRLVTKAFPRADKNSIEQVSIQHFIDTLDNNEIKIQIRRKKPQTLSEALNIALEEESLQQVGGRPKVATLTDSVTLESLQKQITNLESKLQCKQNSFPRRTPYKKDSVNRNFKNLHCYRCNEPGHVMANCPLNL